MTSGGGGGGDDKDKEEIEVEIDRLSTDCSIQDGISFLPTFYNWECVE